jgi:hypothetical protein
MTVEERFEYIDKALLGVIEAQRVQSESISQLGRVLSQSIDLAEARARCVDENLRHLSQNLDQLTLRVSQFVELADAPGR